jgi:hypothetical protein
MGPVESEGGSAASPASEAVTLKYNFTRPVEIGKFSESLEGLAEFYRQQVPDTDEVPKELRLFIKEIRKGSIEVDLVEMVKVAGGAVAPVLSDIKIAVEAFQRAKQVIDWLKGDGTKAVEPTKKEIEAVSHFLAPVAENSGSNVQLNVNNSPNAIIMIGSVDANAIQNGATKALERMREPVKQTLHEVPLVWVQTDRQGATTGRTGLKAIVEEASPNPMPVYFAEAERAALKEGMIDGVEYPYRKTFIVDVETIVVMGRLKGFKILKLYDVFD